MARVALILAALNGLLGVAGGAFGAHWAGSSEAAGWLRTGAEYQMVHAATALALLAVPLAHLRFATYAALLMGLGGLLFGGSLALMALGFPRGIALVTPLGGVLMLAGWAALLAGLLVDRSDHRA